MSSTEAAPPSARRVTATGVLSVASAELRRRRASPWTRALVLWCAGLAGVLLIGTALLGLLTPSITQYSGTTTHGVVLAAGTRPSEIRLPWLEVSAGPTLFAILSWTVLAGGVVAGAVLAATARADQADSTPVDRELGAALAAWVGACAFVVAGIPFLALTLVAGAGPATSVLRVALVVAALTAASCGIARGLATTRDRTAGRVVRLTVGAFVIVTVATPILVGLSRPLVTTTGPVQVYTRLASSPTNTDNPDCGLVPAQRRTTHTERSWWVQVANPVLVLADAAGTAEPESWERSSVSWAVDPLDGLRHGVHLLRAGSPRQLDECVHQGASSLEATVSRAPYWGWGVAWWLLLGAGGLALSARRLRA